MSFRSDNWAPASDRIMAALAAANAGSLPAYGADPWTDRARAECARVFGREVGFVTVPTGTAANGLAIEMGCGRDGVLVCHEEAHSIDAEAASRALLNPALAIVPVSGHGGKMAPDALERALAAAPRQRRIMVSLTNVTEAGLVYAAAEIAALAQIARRYGAMLHVDGARFANAVVATGETPAGLSWRCGVDLLSFGATKAGALAAEAVVAFDPALEPAMLEARKAFGYTFSKGRFAGAQFAAFLESDHWLELARTANARAQSLSQGFRSLGLRLAWPTQANEVFPVMTRQRAEQMRAGGTGCHDWWVSDFEREQVKPGPDETIVRFVASFATTEAEIARALELAAATHGTRAPAHTG